MSVSFPSKTIVFDVPFNTIPTIELKLYDASGDEMACPVSATNVSTTGFTIPAFTVNVDMYVEYDMIPYLDWFAKVDS